MPQLNIHWKGYPHHRLPRIRVASTPRNSIPTRSQIAAKQVLQIPLGSTLEETRKKQRFNFRLRRRRARSSRSTSAVVRSRRQAAQRARQHIEVFGWGTSQAERASRATFENSALGTSSIKARVDTRSSAVLRNPNPPGSIIPSTDGATSSSIRRIKADKREPENLYSLMHVAEVPIYWKSSKPANRKKSSFNSNRLSIYSAKGPGAEYAHVGPLETVSRRNTYRGSQTLERRRTYDCRIDPKKRVEEHRSRSGPTQVVTNVPGPQTRARSRVPPDKKQQSCTSAELLETVNSLALQTRAKGSDSLSNKTIVPSVFSDNGSRTSSQRKALKKFTREIELYLQACRSLPKVSLVATPSLTTISAFTVDEFKPYQAQFQSAGLAVTSDEQRGLVKLQEEPSPPPTPPKDLKWSKVNSSSDEKMVFQNNKLNDKSQKRREPSYVSGSSGTTMIGFTSPDERSYPRPSIARKPSSDSDHTIIGFTPPHERVAPPPARPSRSAPKTSTKKSLPWLRRPIASPEPVSPTKKMSSPEADEHRPSTLLKGWVTTVDPPTSKGKTPEKLRKGGPSDPPQPGILQRSTNVQWNDMKYGSETDVVNTKGTVPIQQAQMSTQADDVNFDATETCLYTTTYADMSTQTNADVEAARPNIRETTMKDNEVEMKKAPIVSGRNKTFPLTKSNCRGDCNAVSEPIFTSSGLRHRKRSRVEREGVDREIQTDNIEPVRLQHHENQSRRSRKGTFELELNAGERSSLFSSPLSTAQGSGPLQASPSLRSPSKSVDEAKFLTDTQFQDTVKSNVLSTENHIPPPGRQAPSPMLCTKCANELKPTALEPDSQSEPQAEPESDPEPASMVGLDHSCTKRSTPVCQQCFPSRQTSTAISPLETSPPEVQYAPSRRSTRSIIPAGPVTYLEVSARPPTVDQGNDEAVKGDPSPAERFQPIQTVQDIAMEYTSEPPIADPMKKLSLPRLKLKLPPAPEQKQYSTPARPRPVPPVAQPVTVINLPIQLPDLASISSLDTVYRDPGKITDKQVFKGLHVASAAAYDEDVDKWIEEITGCGVRKFLADLSRFEGLGVNTLADVAKRAARQRREKLRVWETVREARVAQRDIKREERSRGVDESCGARDEQVDWVMGEMGVVAGDEREEDLGCRMVHSRGCKGSKGVK